MAKIENASVKKRKTTTKSTPVKSAPPALNIVKPGLGQHLKLVLFGPPKTGKTTAAVSGEGRKLLIETEPDGDLPLLGREDVDVVRPTTGKELAGIVTALHGGAVKDYDRVILDSATFAFEIVGGAEIKKVLASGRDIRNVYGKVGAALGQILHDFFALPVDVVITTQLRHYSFDEDDEDKPGPEEGKYPFTLEVTPMIYKVLSPGASVIGRTYKKRYVDSKGNKKTQYLVSFEDYGRSPAGSRIPVPETVEDLNLDMLASALKGET